MFDTIIWATDGSDLSDGALPLVKELARLHDATIVAVHADSLRNSRFGVPVPPDDDPGLQTKLRSQVGALRDEGFPAELRVAFSSTQSPAEVIVELAKEIDADLIVVATHAYGIVGSLFFGSVAKSLVHEAPCPILTIPPPVALAAAEAEEGAVMTV